jgi:hypothetical protein
MSGPDFVGQSKLPKGGSRDGRSHKGDQEDSHADSPRLNTSRKSIKFLHSGAIPQIDRTRHKPPNETSPLHRSSFCEPRVAQSHATVVVPLYKRVIFVRLLDCSEFSSRLSKIAQTLDAISGIQFRVRSRGLDKRWSPGSVCIRRGSSM